MVAISSTVGKALNSSGFSMNSAVSRIRTDGVMEMARQRSSRRRAAAGSARRGLPARRRRAGRPPVAMPASAAAILPAARPMLAISAARSARHRRCRTVYAASPYSRSLLRRVRIEMPRIVDRMGTVAQRVPQSVNNQASCSTSAMVRPTRPRRAGAGGAGRARRRARCPRW